MSSNEVADQQELDALFPVPSLPPSPLSPQRFPGSSLESVAALQHVLKDNHNRYHIFFNYVRFHDHAGYRALAIYALGGSASLIKNYYEQDGKNQRPAVKSPGPITEENFVEHLGDENFYQGYVTFFNKQIDEKGAAGTLEEFIFSEKYNFQDGRDATRQPEMLFRLMDGLLHPMIHVGYGIEFGLKGMLAEGLALCACTGRGDLLSSLVFNAKPAATPILSKIGGVHAFDIIARMLKDDQLKPKGGRDLVFQWKDVLAELGTAGEIERKMEELIWVSSVTYGVGGFDAEKEFTPDFYLCPIPSLLDRIPFSTIASLSLAFLPHIGPNLIQRAFAHSNTLYGLRPAGYFAGTELEGAELLDGSLFVRAAIHTADSMGWVWDGKDTKTWSMEPGGIS
ncbi:hypothetical protein BU15DRAFT_83025 [Melanogaster broomeanus]|nr:hypothetical protein BU15DRAFT_83025 [Melanogaster broomeanus]